MNTSSDRAGCLLIGATGYVGSQIGAAIELAGFELFQLRRGPGSDSVPSTFYGDLNGDFPIESLITFIRSNGIDSVVHCGNVFSREASPTVVERMLYANFLIPAKVVAAGVEAGASLFINLGSGWQLDPKKFAESPPYTLSKNAFRSFVSNYSPSITSKSIFVNEVFGLGDTRDKLVNNAIRSAASGEHFKVRSSLAVLGFTNVVALALEVVRVLRKPDSRPREYLYQNYSNVTVGQVLATIEELAGRLDWSSSLDVYEPDPLVSLNSFGERPFDEFKTELAAIINAQDVR